MHRICCALLAVAVGIVCLSPADVYAAGPSKFALAKRKIKAWVRVHVVKPPDVEKYRLVLDRNWRQADADASLVVLVHGFNSTPESNEALLVPLRQAGFPCGTFRYPNDHALDASAELLSRELKEFAARHPQRSVALVTHSMGGLIARACVEDAALDPGNVRRLIMIAPPTHGSVLANFAVGTDLWEHCIRSKGEGPMARLRSSIADGLAEAVVDLRPCSPFLTKLNARPLNKNVAYTILLGTGGKVQPVEMVALRHGVRLGGKAIPFGRKISDRINRLLGDFDEVVAGKGDGVVAVKRARLDGVKDTVVLRFGHLSVTGPPKDRSIEKVHAAVLSRLQGKRD